MAFNDDSSASGHDEPWIQWFCGLKGHEMFCEVERSYIEDGFNLYGLRACVSNFSDCLDLILDRIGPDDSDDSHLTQSACTLYGLIHARYIITAHGLDAMYNKYAAKEFGGCPLVQCQGQPVLPVGLKDEMGVDTTKLFCPKCQRVYHAPPLRSSRSSTSMTTTSGGNPNDGGNNRSGVDGAAFGSTFPHLFLMTFSNLVPDPLPVTSTYVPRVFGFRIHKKGSKESEARGRAIAASKAAAADRQNVAQAAVEAKPAPAEANAEDATKQEGAAAGEPAQQQEPGEQQDDGEKKASRSRQQSGGKRERSDGGAPGKKASEAENGGPSAGAGPVFLVDNSSSKRRRRNNGST